MPCACPLAAAQSAGFEAWCEFYAEMYGGVRLAQAMAPWRRKRDLAELQGACRFWWQYAKAVAARSGGIAPARAVRILVLERASRLFQRWAQKAEARRVRPTAIMQLPYGQLLRQTLEDWREALLVTTARRLQQLREMLAIARDHDAAAGMRNALLDW